MLPVLGISQDDSLRLQFELSIPENVQLNKCRGYISNIVLHYEDGSSSKEEHSYHLINFLEPTRISIHNTSDSPISSIDYAIGTDSIINVTGVYDGDLDPIHGMYWAWNSGYINFKMEGTQNEVPFSYHIGGYANPYPTFRAKTHNVTSKNPSYTIRVDIGRILSSELAQSLPRLMSPGENASKLADILADSIQLYE